MDRLLRLCIHWRPCCRSMGQMGDACRRSRTLTTPTRPYLVEVALTAANRRTGGYPETGSQRVNTKTYNVCTRLVSNELCKMPPGGSVTTKILICTRRAGNPYRARSRLYHSRSSKRMYSFESSRRENAQNTKHTFEQLESNLKIKKSASGKRHPGEKQTPAKKQADRSDAARPGGSTTLILPCVFVKIART